MGVAALLLALEACVSSPTFEVRRSPQTWARMVTERGVDPARVPDPFAVSPEMERVAREIVVGLPADSGLVALQETLLDAGRWAFEYDVLQTFTAADAFAARRGNCVSYANLFIALGRSVGIPVRAALLSRRPSSSREGDLVVVYKHLVAAHVTGRTASVFDFAGNREGDVASFRLLDDLSVAALAASNRGVESLRRNDLEAARAALEDAARLAPSLPSVYANLGLVLFRKGDVSGALDTYRRGLEIAPPEPSILQNLAALYEAEGKQGEARAALAAVDAGRASPHALIVLGNLELGEGRVSAAMRRFREAARLAPNSIDPLVAVARGERARGREKAARKALKRALMLEPGSAEVRALLGE